MTSQIVFEHKSVGIFQVLSFSYSCEIDFGQTTESSSGLIKFSKSEIDPKTILHEMPCKSLCPHLPLTI